MYKSLPSFLAGAAFAVVLALVGCNANLNELEAAAQAVATATQSLSAGQATYGYVGNVSSVSGLPVNVGIVAGTNVSAASAAACAASVNSSGVVATPSVVKTLPSAAPTGN